MKRKGLFKNLARSFAILCLVGTTVTHVSAAQAGRYQVKINQPNAELVLTFSSPPNYTTRSTEQGVVLSFDKEIGALDLASAQAQLSSWVLNLWASYDAILLKTRAGINVDFLIKGRQLHIYFKPGKVAAGVPKTTVASSTQALDRVKALLILESGHPTEARKRFQELLSYSPNNVQLLLDLARTEEKLSRWREALAFYEQAQQLRPDSTAISNEKKRLLDTYGSKVTAGIEYAETGDDSTQSIVRLKGQKLTESKMLVSVTYERLDAEEKAGVRRVNGDVSPYDVTRDKLTVELEAPLKQGVQRFSLYGGAKKLGAGWAYAQGSDYGLTQVGAEWKRPWFETQEAIIGYGYRDRLVLSHNQSFRQQYSVYGELSINRYGLDGVSAAAKSHRVQVGGRYWFQPTGEGFSIGYGLDWENVVDRAKRNDRLGNPFSPLPLDTREQHVVDVGWYAKLKDDLTIDAQLGYEYDRRRDANAPFGRFQLAFKPETNIEWDIALQTGLSSYRNKDEDFFRIGSNVTWHF